MLYHQSIRLRRSCTYIYIWARCPISVVMSERVMITDLYTRTDHTKYVLYEHSWKPTILYDSSFILHEAASTFRPELPWNAVQYRIQKWTRKIWRITWKKGWKAYWCREQGVQCEGEPNPVVQRLTFRRNLRMLEAIVI